MDIFIDDVQILNLRNPSYKIYIYKSSSTWNVIPIIKL